jgi:polar amino acid transport system permease protein
MPEILVNYGDDLLDGFLVTCELVAISIVCGAALGALLARGRDSAFRPVRWLVAFYVALFRGTPLLAQLFLIYYGAGQFAAFWRETGLWWFLREPFYCAALTFTLNTAAYQAIIFRGAVEAVPRGQWEAAQALGLSRRVTFLKVILPQAAIIALRPFGNEIILMIKGSAVASVVTVYDLLGETRLAYSNTFRFDVYFYAAALYLILVETLRRVFNVAEAYLTRHLATRTPPEPAVVTEEPVLT